MDVDSGLILVSVTTTDNTHDGKVFRERIVGLLKAIRALLGLGIVFVLANAIYDSEEHVQLVRSNLGALSLINIAKHGGAIKNSLRLFVGHLVEANRHIYGRRLLLEAAFKTIKRFLIVRLGLRVGYDCC